ncbi:MAG: hypothetical protein EBR17_09420 [Betaproteobacteria bacterium]|jgi:flagellar biosynthesis protein FlhF|nr:hypothetical protein [Rhodoferax sp.]MCX7264482.1 hypothetical protein [Burkholderiales bacterium]NBX15332.1 hypothetical protein [Betaproteobacteria bacterium]NBX91117.1 hypothetical protein [Betaproteobacteria bacterium]
MELKRILAPDTRSATEKAMALYGPDVLIISNHRMGGQTELVVALELAEATLEVDDEQEEITQLELGASPVPASPAAAASTMAAAIAHVKTHAFDAHLQQVLTPAPRPAAAPLTPTEQVREDVRGKEIVSLVMEELSALRHQIRLSQQTSAWQSQQSWPEQLQPLVTALSEAAVPTALRTLLLEGLKDSASLAQAQESLRQQLLCNLNCETQEFASKGVHALAGPSGSGKTLMTLRWAQQIAQAHGHASVAVVSFQDERAGAWQQIQTLCSQIHVDCYRAADVENLSQVMAQLSNRPLVLIDTAGVQMTERLIDILAVYADCDLHAVLPLDASSVTLRRILSEPGLAWRSLMLTKLDESSAPWPLLQFLSNDTLGAALSVASHSQSIDQAVTHMTPDLLVDLAISKLMPQADTFGSNASHISSFMPPAWTSTATKMVAHG